MAMSSWDFMWGFYTRRYTLVHGFCFFKLFRIGLYLNEQSTARYLLDVVSCASTEKIVAFPRDFPARYSLICRYIKMVSAGMVASFHIAHTLSRTWQKRQMTHQSSTYCNQEIINGLCLSPNTDGCFCH